ncbi:DUF2510 domain-containing protein [Cellulomonas pakistanensis]|nr:DUF2510 domain-containing protein [Cellulomonas pakistanensis]
MTEALPLPPAGWYPDGVTAGVLRWFDGAAWTEHTAPDPEARPVVPVPAPVPAAVAAPFAALDAPAHRPPGAHAAANAGAPAHARPRPSAAPASEVGHPYAAPAGAHGGSPYAAAPATAWYPEPERLGARPGDPVHWLLPTGRSWQSIAAGYVGLLALLVWPLGPVAVWLGLWAIRRGRVGGHGRGRAVFAVVVGTAVTVVLAYLLASGALTT